MILRRLGPTLILTLALGARPVLAQPAADEGLRAVEVGHDGIALYQAGKFTEALAKFREADAISHSPVFQLYIARCHVQQGRLLAARQTYQRIVARPDDEREPAPWSNARVDARDELAALLPRIPSVQLVVTGADASLTVTVDGAAAQPGAVIEVDPGQRNIVAVQDGARREMVVDIRERQKGRVVEIGLRRQTPTKQPSPPLPRTEKGSVVPGAVLAGVGGAALVAGTITGALALTQASDIEDRCGRDDGKCARSLEADVQPDIDAATTLGSVTTALLIGGGVLGSVGVVLVVVRPGGADDGRNSPAMLSFRPSLGGGALRGRF